MWGSGPGGHLKIGGIFSEPWGKAEGENVDMDEKSTEKEGKRHVFLMLDPATNQSTQKAGGIYL
jgi:hypothetical protein